MDDEFQDLQRLLRLKRHEVPPPAYFEDFMAEFHRRQREELLRRPLVASGTRPVRGGDAEFFPDALRVRRGVRDGCGGCDTRFHAHPDRAHRRSGARADADHSVANASSHIDIYTAKPSLRLAPELRFDEPRRVATSSASNRTRYVLDAPSIQPVVYEQRSDF